MRNNKPYKYNAKDRLQKTPDKKKKNKKEEVTQNTIKIDDTRLNDSKSLDTSFLEGRKEKKVSNDQKEKEKILTDRSKTLEKIRFFRNLFLGLSIVCVIILIALYSYDYVKHFINKLHKNEEVEVVEKKVNDKIDSNYLLIGDYHTDKFDFNSFGLDYHYVKIISSDTSDLLNHLKKDVYQYNPSKVFIELGLNDMNSISKEDFMNNIDLIVQNIKKNRPYAEIVIESIYPINSNIEGFNNSNYSNITNQKIKEYNKSLFDYSINNNVEYLDVYSNLIDKDSLDSDYTEDGYTLNKDGYQQLYKLIQKVVG